MKKITLFVFIVVGLLLQTSEVSGKKKKRVDFWPLEQSIQQLFREIRETKDDSLALQLHKQIEDSLALALTIHEAYKHKFDSLGMIGRLYSPHKEFRLFNWNHSSRDGTYRYFALIVLPGKKNMPNKVIRLTETTDTIVRPDQKTLRSDQWLGCLYYKIIPKHKAKDGKKYFTLLGLDMHDLKTKKKYIELLAFNEDGSLQLGAPIIELNKWTKHRVIFEFAAHQSMYLEYNWFRRRIEFDHLAPLMPYLVGEYDYYEPDMFRDGLKFKNGHWKHKKDIKKPPKNKPVRKGSLPKPPKRLPQEKPQEKKPVKKKTVTETQEKPKV